MTSAYDPRPLLTDRCFAEKLAQTGYAIVCLDRIHQNRTRLPGWETMARAWREVVIDEVEYMVLAELRAGGSSHAVIAASHAAVLRGVVKADAAVRLLRSLRGH